ncbi:hypothetical protein [Natronorubrum thiooxidans]|uniref:Uncharacterized protein n=1 Tax=Natronorubrum thiooxidans TaxID=308853 RepID=A0A1N7H8R3_9EURY|nr:hypothetical protein [Natronorubrum thiooxidans]SIS21275.1 hypothetical protein SAMN05421752_1346 [Natronorubrum thiooxidans]
MTDKNYSRRSYLQGFGGIFLAGAPKLTVNTQSTVHNDISASNLLIPESAASGDFEPVTGTNSIPIMSHLRTRNSWFEGAETAAQGYWKGPDEENPHWVLSSLAVVCDQTLCRHAIEEATTRCYSEYVQEYDAETPVTVEFEQSRTHYTGWTDWQMDMLSIDPFSDDPSSSSERLFTDVMRLQYHGNVLLGTVVFGPDAVGRDVSSMLIKYSRFQHSQLYPHQS